MELSITAAAGVGLVVGFRHAFEPDHVAAVTTLAGQRSPLRRALMLGVMWAFGHTAVIAAAGFAAWAMGLRLSATAQSVAELLVAVVLVGMGLGVILRWRKGRWHLHGHRHDGVEHLHVHSHARASSHAHTHPHASHAWALGIDALHGLAGSGAVLALWLAATAARPDGGAWIAWFGAGSALGMLFVTGALWLAMRLAASRGLGWVSALRWASAVAAIAVGIGLAGEVVASLVPRH